MPDSKMKMSTLSPSCEPATSRMNTPTELSVPVNSILTPIDFSMIDQSLSCAVVTP